MAAKENVEIVREIFRAIEDRDLARLVALTDPAAEFHWPAVSAVRWYIAPAAGRRSVVGRNLDSAAAHQGRATHGRAHRGGQRRRGRRALASAGHLAGRRAM